MKKILNIKPIYNCCLLLVACCLLLVACGWFASKEDKEFYNKILYAFDNGSNDLDLLKVANFDWDIVCYSDFLIDLKYYEEYGLINVDKKAKKKFNKIKNMSDVTILIFALDGVIKRLVYYPSQEISYNETNYKIDSDLNCSSASDKVILKVVDTQETIKTINITTKNQ